MSTVLVKYVGLKDREFDKKGGTGMWWSPGESKLVPFGAWLKMSKHPDVWAAEVDAEDEAFAGLSAVATLPVKQEVDDADLVALTAAIVPAETATSDAPDLYAMNTAALREHATAQGYDVDLTLKGQALRTAIVAIEG